nr:uncharacterized protein LOC100185720 [Ciona intestinalis]|eukprot:XP_002127879.1 uncharacterized protein LOC100185720 [Ciona intestinalis]
MWKEKESELQNKCDNDSAIGDSESYSAGEESSHSRRKSSSDEMETDTMDMYGHLNAKLGTKVPGCLCKEAGDSIESCSKIFKESLAKQAAKTPRVIRVVPASVALANTNGNNKKSEDFSPRKDKSDMALKLQYLLHEMKKLRELDREILHQFLRVNDTVDEVKWLMDEREADLKRIMEDDVTSNDVTTHDATNNNVTEWKERTDTDMKYAVPVTAALTSYATLTSVKNSKRSNGVDAMVQGSSPADTSQKSASNPAENGYRSYSNPTYAKVDIGTKHGRPQEPPPYVERQDSYYNRFKASRPTSASSTRSGNPHSDPVWVKQGEPPSQRPKSASAASVSRKFSNRSKPGSVHRAIRDEWIAETAEKSIPEFHKQKDYQNLIGLSRVRAEATSIRGQPRPVARPRASGRDVGSAGSRTSSSSLTSSSSSSSSMHSPTRGVTHNAQRLAHDGQHITHNGQRVTHEAHRITHNGGNSFSRFGVTRQRPEDFRQRTDMKNNNYKPKPISRKRQPVFPTKDNVVVMSYKRTTTDSVYSWIQSQDDVTYL